MHGYDNYKKCKTCGEFYWEGGDPEHTCPPIMYFKHEEYGDEWEEIRSRSHYEAALSFAKKYDECEHDLLEYGDTEVLIFDGKVEKTFIVSAEATIDYFATEKEDEKNTKNEK